jgi:adenylate cyclase
LSLSFEERRVVLRETLRLLSKELETERLGNVRRLAQIRLFTVLVFFFLHLILGYALQLETFRGKEILFSVYLIVSCLLWLAAQRSSSIRNASSFAIPFVDLPFTFLILDTWAQGKGMQGQISTGLLGLSFMMFFISLSGFYFSKAQSVLTGIIALILTLMLHLETQVPRDSTVIGLALLVVSVVASHLKASRLDVLVRRSFDEHLRTEKLSRYFSPAVAQLLQSKQDDVPQDGMELDLTILFADIRDFTKMSSDLSGLDTVRLLNEVHEQLVKCIFETNGTLDKYIGDGVMAYFGAPSGNELHADQAVACAIKMRFAIAQLNESRVGRGQEPIHIGIGLHSGRAVVGDVGAHFRREFTVIGDTVNTASRIESLTKKHKVDILVSDAVRERVRHNNHFVFQGEDVLRGKNTVMRTYTLA